MADPSNANAAGRSGGQGKKKFHLFAAEMSLACACGLNSWYPDWWYRNSAIIHATVPSPLGSFVHEEQVLHGRVQPRAVRPDAPGRP